MLVASTSASVYGQVVWNPVTYLKMLLEDNYDAKHRAGAFFIAAGFVYSLLFSVSSRLPRAHGLLRLTFSTRPQCVFENIYCEFGDSHHLSEADVRRAGCGNDLASLCPKYISVKRGFWICLLGCAAFCPWYLLGTASRFITVLASYQVRCGHRCGTSMSPRLTFSPSQIFLFSICGLIMSDYFLVSKGLFNYRDLYTMSKKGTCASSECEVNVARLLSSLIAFMSQTTTHMASTGAHSRRMALVWRSTLPAVRSWLRPTY